MLKLLVKKQLSEIFRAYFYDAKKNKSRSKVSTILFMLWFAVIMTGVLGGYIYDAFKKSLADSDIQHFCLLDIWCFLVIHWDICAILEFL